MKNKKIKKALQISAFVALGLGCVYQQLTHDPDLTITIGQPDMTQSDSPAMQHALDNSDSDSHDNSNDFSSVSSFGQKTFRL